MAEPLSIADYERLAEDRLEPGPWAYLAGGSGDEWTLRENRAAFARWTFRPRVLVDVAEVTTATTVLGTPLELPVVVAPVAYQRLYHPDGECATARGAAAAGAVHVPSRRCTPLARGDRGRGAGARAVVPALRLPGRGDHARAPRGRRRGRLHARSCSPSTRRCSAQRERDLRVGFEIPSDLPLPYARAAIGDAPQNPADARSRCLDASVSWRDLEWIAERDALPVVLKGILTRRGRGARRRARRGGDRRLEPRRPAARRRSRDARRAAGGGRRGRRTGRGLSRRRHPARHRRRQGTRARRTRGARRPRAGLGPRGRRRGGRAPRPRAPARRDGARRSACSAARSPDELTRAHVQPRSPMIGAA